MPRWKPVLTSNSSAIRPAGSSSCATSRRIARRRGSASARRASSVVRSSGTFSSRSHGPDTASGPEPDPVAVRVGEDGEPAEPAGQVGRRDEAGAAELLGPVPLPQEEIDRSHDRGSDDDLARLVLRVPRSEGAALSAALADLQRGRSARKQPHVRVEVDPIRLG